MVRIGRATRGEVFHFHRNQVRSTAQLATWFVRVGRRSQQGATRVNKWGNSSIQRCCSWHGNIGAESQSDVAKLARINQGYYSRIENGLLPGEPAGDTVDRLSVALRFPRGFFYQYDRVYGLPISIHPMHRKRADVGERALQQLHAELNVRLAHLRRLLKATEFTQERPLPKIDVDDGGGPEKVAATVRLAWGLPPGPVANLTECAERSGVLVVWCRFSANVDGVTLHSSDLPPCIFLNASAPADRIGSPLPTKSGIW